MAVHDAVNAHLGPCLFALHSNSWFNLLNLVGWISLRQVAWAENIKVFTGSWATEVIVKKTASSSIESVVVVGTWLSSHFLARVFKCSLCTRRLEGGKIRLFSLRSSLSLSIKLIDIQFENSIHKELLLCSNHCLNIILKVKSDHCSQLQVLNVENLLFQDLINDIIKPWKLVLIFPHELVHLHDRWSYVRFATHLFVLWLDFQEVLVSLKLLLRRSKHEHVLVFDVLHNFNRQCLSIANRERTIHQEPDLLVILLRHQEMSQISVLIYFMWVILWPLHLRTSHILPCVYFLALNNHQPQTCSFDQERWFQRL